jgi:putative ABC transport system permease protein
VLKNYLLLAFKVLRRHQFYTVISLFGIAVTLMVLIVVTSLIESFVHPGGPERNSDRFLVAGAISMVHYVDGKMQARSTNTLGYRFIESGVLTMTTPELISVFSGAIGGKAGSLKVTGFRGGVRIVSAAKRTDANYWKILQFDFLEGRPISQQEHEQGAYVAVISEATRNLYFRGGSAVGKTLTLDGSTYKVIGVVRDVSPLQTLAVADVWIPIFATQSTQFRSEDRGKFMVLLQGRTPADLPLIQEEYQVVVNSFAPVPPAWFTAGGTTKVYSWALPKFGTYLQVASRQIDKSPEQSGIGTIVATVLSTVALLFMLLPIMNLVNINISRILERTSEIGVRKSFGASSGQLVRQFIVENLVVTGLGGLLGFLLAIVALSTLAGAGLLPNESFQFSYRVFAMGLLYIIVFGVLSAAWPAWKMSRLDPVLALKGAVT